MYKITYLKDSDTIAKIYAFVGASEITATGEWFSEEELEIGIIIVNQSIFIDDSIYAIKLKLAYAIQQNDNEMDMPSIEEMYFFGQTNKYVNLTVLFEKQQINGVITKQQYFNIIQNITEQEFSFDKNKEEYTHEDVMQLLDRDETYNVNFAIGQFSNETYVINPTNITDDDEAINVVSHNSHLLLEYPTLLNSTIYVCLFEDAADKIDIVISNYFPSLNVLGFSKKLSASDKSGMRKETIGRIKGAESEFNKINMWNEIFRQRTTDINYNGRGIKSVSLTITPEYTMKIPIDVIFKLIHASKNIPLIKYNFSFKQDNIYRLYVDRRTATGEKIPHLPKAEIFNLMKTIGKTKSVAVYSKYDAHDVVCEFEPSGNITIKIEFNDPLPYKGDFDMLNEIIGTSMIPINEAIMPFFEQNGYRLPSFNDINMENIIINDLTLQISARVGHTMNIADYYSCVSSVFNIVIVEGNNMGLQFKRIGGYNVLHAQQNFIIENKKRNVTNINIKKKLMVAFNLSELVATTRIATVLDEMAQEQQLHRRNKTSKMYGFETSITTNRIDGNIIFTVKGITHLNYLNTIPIYIDSWIRLSQPEYTTGFPYDTVSMVCLGGVAEDVVEEEEEEPEIQSPGVVVASERESDESESDGESSEDELTKIIGKRDIIGIRDSSSSSSPSTGGGPKKAKKPQVEAEAIHNIDGMSLSHPYFFQQRMEDRAKTLFSSLKNDKFKSYSRMCPSSIRRQPVILSTEELNKTREEYPEDYNTQEDVLTYSSNKENKDNPETFHYVCPRYWCLKTNSIISEEDVKAGKCGKILPADATKVIKDHYVYEFSAAEEHLDEKGEYIKHFPGFHKNATGDNKCIPCCYKKFSDKQVERRAQCEGTETDSGFSLKSGDDKEEKEEKEKGEEKKGEEEKGEEKKDAVEEYQYILGPEKFPLGAGRWGKLPISIQQFFKDVGSECKVNKNNKNKSSCLLRHGVEKHEMKSFLACIIDALYYAEYDARKEPLDLLDVRTFIKDKLLDAFDLDTFLEYQNGTLYDNFSKIDRRKNKSFEKVDDKYKSTQLYSNSMDSKETRQVFMNVLDAYEEFCIFLQDEKSYIDYTYLWDMICRPNPKLFASGLNLIILNIPDSDSTTNVEFICPTNHYSKEVYESRRRTLILLSRDDFFEPVYEYKDIETKIIVTKTFSEYDRYLSTGMHYVLTQIIKPLVREHCKPTKLKIYNYEAPPLLDDLIKTINTRKYKIQTQVLNLRGKIVGILAEDTRNVIGFIPCYPAAINPKLKKQASSYYKYITDDIWTTYERTIGFLNRWNKIKIKTAAKMVSTKKCTPDDAFCKVVEDDVIVGFLTNTNQFIQITDPIPNTIHDNIPQINNNNYLIADNSIANADQNKTHVARMEYSKKIKLENNFYGAFRGAIRILLNDYANLANQKEIIKEIYNPHTLYAEKLTNVTQLLKELTTERIQFVDSVDIDENEIVASCLSVEEDKCVKSPMCFYSDAGCGLNIPKKNLLSPDTDNETLYYSKMADEMVRYNRIKTFIFQRKNYLLFESLGYNLREDEIIILQSLITQKYFENLVPSKQNARLGNAYDTANPKESYKRREITMEDIINPNIDIVPTQGPIKYAELKHCMPVRGVEITYPATISATFQFAIDIIHRITNESLTQNQIRDKLSEIYSIYSNKYKIQIANILIQQGKKTFGSYIRAGTLEIKHMIYTEGYYLTNLDMWLLLDHYNIQSILISHKLLLETVYETKEFCLFVNEEEDHNNLSFVFIINSAIKIETPPMFKYVELEGNPEISMDDIQESCASEFYACISNKVEIEDYIKSFKPILTTKYVKKQPGLRQQLSSDSDGDKDSGDKDSGDKDSGDKDSGDKDSGDKDSGDKEMDIPDLGATQVSDIAPKQTRRKYTKKAENRHKKRVQTKKSSSS